MGLAGRPRQRGHGPNLSCDLTPQIPLSSKPQAGDSVEIRAAGHDTVLRDGSSDEQLVEHADVHTLLGDLGVQGLEVGALCGQCGAGLLMWVGRGRRWRLGR